MRGKAETTITKLRSKKGTTFFNFHFIIFTSKFRNVITACQKNLMGQYQYRTLIKSNLIHRPIIRLYHIPTNDIYCKDFNKISFQITNTHRTATYYLIIHRINIKRNRTSSLYNLNKLHVCAGMDKVTVGVAAECN